MKIRSLALATAFAAFAGIAVPADVAAADPATQTEAVKTAFKHAIANVPGKTLTAVIVDYAPGAKSLPHRHGEAFVVAYVLSGAIRSKVDDGKEQVFHAGENWVEAPGAHHLVSENASDAEPARLLAIFVGDNSQDRLVTFDKK
jgi:quercetin dioxygenase-like cupin family protein